jgi:signal transduction histidine kinase
MWGDSSMPDLEIKRDLLARAFPDLPAEMLHPLAEKAALKTYPADQILCYEDRHENTFYIIKEGEVAFSKRMGNEDHILRKGSSGDFFGEMALLDETIGRSATVKTLHWTTVLELERAAFTDLIAQAPQLVFNMAKIIIHRMRDNDRQALAELQAQKQEIERAYADLKKLDEQRHIFLTTMAHELRTPLTSVMGYMQLVRGGHMTGAGLTMSLEKIGTGLDRMVSLINDLFFLQEMDILDPRFKKVQLADLLSEVILKCQDYAERQKVTLVYDKPNDLPDMLGEYDGLARAMWHLVDNAIKFSPNGGEVRVTALLEADLLTVQVQDHGVGIDPAFMPRIFERFVRDEKYEGHLFDGTGLGMPIVKQIVEMHSGTIEIASVRGQGTTVTVRLPLDARRATVELNIEDAWVDVPE